MKKLFLLLSVVMSALTAVTRAADPVAEVTYTGEISGIVCASCKEHVTTMLMKKIDGVVSVDVKPADKPEGNQKLIIVAKNASITKESATEALGTFAKNYEIVSLTKKG
jgi:copper chaperone CopZ